MWWLEIPKGEGGVISCSGRNDACSRSTGSQSALYLRLYIVVANLCLNRRLFLCVFQKVFPGNNPNGGEKAYDKQEAKMFNQMFNDEKKMTL